MLNPIATIEAPRPINVAPCSRATPGVTRFTGQSIHSIHQPGKVPRRTMYRPIPNNGPPTAPEIPSTTYPTAGHFSQTDSSPRSS